MAYFGYSREEWLTVVPVLSEHRLRAFDAPHFRRCNYFVYLCLPTKLPTQSTIVVTDAELLELLPEPLRNTFRRIAKDRRRLCQK